jgi:membrane-bound lytic murein transglycosylase D
MRIVALFFAATLSAAAQTPQVPRKMDFGGITLSIRDDARKEMQKDVDALWQSPRHLAVKVEKARTYFPVIEKIFEEERIPDDFKYLVLQESALIPDAVSVSNAVGGGCGCGAHRGACRDPRALFGDVAPVECAGAS